MALSHAIAQVQAQALAVKPMMRAAPANAPVETLQFPFAVTYAAEVDWKRVSDWKEGLQTIVAEIHWSRDDLPTAIAHSVDVGEALSNAILKDLRLGGTVEAIVGVHGNYGYLPWEDQKDVHIGWRFEIQVKMSSPIA